MEESGARPMGEAGRPRLGEEGVRRGVECVDESQVGALPLRAEEDVVRETGEWLGLDTMRRRCSENSETTTVGVDGVSCVLGPAKVASPSPGICTENGRFGSTEVFPSVRFVKRGEETLEFVLGEEEDVGCDTGVSRPPAMASNLLRRELTGSADSDSTSSFCILTGCAEQYALATARGSFPTGRRWFGSGHF